MARRPKYLRDALVRLFDGDKEAADVMLEVLEERRKRNRERHAREAMNKAARELKVSGEMIRKAEKVSRERPDLYREVISGQITVSKALELTQSSENSEPESALYVKIPEWIHKELAWESLLTGKTIREIVKEALEDRYRSSWTEVQSD